MNDRISYPDGITPEMLMAYADGVLGATEAGRVEAAISVHPELAAEVEAYRETSRMLAEAFDAPLTSEVPSHLEALVMGTARQGGNVVPLQSARERRAGSLPAWGQAVAACAVFAFGAFFGSHFPGAPPANEEEGVLVAGRLSADNPLSRALETALAATTVEIPGGRFDAVATFPTVSGDLCREFEATGARGAVIGIACRRTQDWTIELLLHAELTEDPQGSLQPASGLDSGVVDAVLDGLGAETGLSADEEACLIERNWQRQACL